ncbi:TetR/AcrR family transcriptional regulator [Curtobacterium pusillum]|uniref:AcrR family transcriptional regulator n=1 Tax=Curtobacterium pusillum TaxID=69373 RepID=A0AAW3TD99_9MICO|nr:TetR/AcrR family transcriptional regulator [Curtobacterium pusillum]MBA8992022.1 AcrR family transcriptional regulator [Curtobacterium pusillum]NUU12658.1 TetR/AcrR family transcriptional regulator [Curtobacterium pusillum]GLK33077.1 TetR family transcriptional regulator [Curtobacterium pusillum]
MSTTTEQGYATGRARRERIIAAATELFGRVGFNGATMLEVASACSISRAGLSHHFPTKESLLEAVLETRDKEDLERFRRNGSQGTDGLGILRGMVDLAAHNSAVPGIIGLYAVLSAEAGSPDHPAHAYFISRYERIRRGTASALRRAADRGYLRAGVDQDAAAVELTAIMDGLQVQWLLDPTSVDMSAAIRRRIEELLTVPLYDA